MDMWTEYEGATIDNAFPLKKLLQTEGRSAFFSTLNANGECVLIRIIECHFDEDEILARWRGVQSLGHRNFMRIDRFGQFHNEENNITAVYAVFERVDEKLGEVLERGRLCAADAAEIGLGVASALEALHANGFVHEHVETGNIYAVGGDVKLRSDCIRETPEGEEGRGVRRRDAHDLALVLRQVLLGSPRDSSAWREYLLPAPFDQIVCNGINGSWGLAEIRATLARHDRPKAAKEKNGLPGASLAMAAPSATQVVPEAISAVAPPAESVAASHSTNGFLAEALAADKPAKPGPQPERSPSPGSKDIAAVLLPGEKPSPMEVPVIFGISEQALRKWLAVGVLLLGTVLISLIMLHHWFGHRAGQNAQATSAQDASARSNAVAIPPMATSQAGAPAPRAGSESRVEWRVVVFTYNRQDQAQRKALSLAQQHPGLSPTIFSPTGRAPWLVTVGGVLERDAAYALARQAPSLGLPRDTYAQDYTVH